MLPILTLAIKRRPMLWVWPFLTCQKYILHSASFTISAALKVSHCVGTVKFNITLSTQSIDPKVQSAQSNKRNPNQELYSDLYNKYFHKYGLLWVKNTDTDKSVPMQYIQKHRNVERHRARPPLPEHRLFNMKIWNPFLLLFRAL